jgi:hypothetical protein
MKSEPHFKSFGTIKYPRIDRQTLPLAYIFGLNLVWPRFVVKHVTVGGAEGYAKSVRLVMTTNELAPYIPSGN